MKKYIDLIAYPAMLLVVYALMGILQWDRNPGTWEYGARATWICWSLAWGWALQCRIRGFGVDNAYS